MVAGPPPDAAELLARVRAAHAAPLTVTADAKAFVSAPENGGRYPLHIAVRRADSLHLEALTPLGDPAAVLVASGGRFALLDLRNDVFYRGPASPRNLARLLPAPLSAEELVAAICGAMPELPGGTPTAARRNGGGWALTLANEAGEGQEVTLGGDLRVVSVRRTAPDGELRWALQFDEHDDASGAQLAQLIHLSAPAAKTEIDLRLRNIDAGHPPPQGAFLLGAPPGMRVEEVR